MKQYEKSNNTTQLLHKKIISTTLTFQQKPQESSNCDNTN